MHLTHSYLNKCIEHSQTPRGFQATFWPPGRPGLQFGPELCPLSPVPCPRNSVPGTPGTPELQGVYAAHGVLLCTWRVSDCLRAGYNVTQRCYRTL